MARKNKISKKPYNKSFLRRIRLFIDNILFIYKFILLTVFFCLCIALYFSSDLNKKVTNSLYSKLAERYILNLKLDNVYLEGQSHVSHKEVAKILSQFINIGDPILNVPLNKIKSQLETVDWVDHVIVERRLPSTLFIKIIEKKPIAIWQYKGRLGLIDQNGKIITYNNIDEFSNLLLLIGNEAPAHLNSLIKLLKQSEEIFHEVTVATRVSQRRWNIKLANGAEIKLPEKGESEAWNLFSSLYNKNKLKGEFKVIDLRIPGKIYINGEIENFEFDNNR